jgi:hypothetical protein
VGVSPSVRRSRWRDDQADSRRRRSGSLKMLEREEEEEAGVEAEVRGAAAASADIWVEVEVEGEVDVAAQQHSTSTSTAPGDPGSLLLLSNVVSLRSSSIQHNTKPAIDLRWSSSSIWAGGLFGGGWLEMAPFLL